MGKKKETPNNDWVGQLSTTRKDKILYHIRPTSNVESLMELAPFQDPILIPLETTASIKELLGEVIDDLSAEDRWIFNALVVERLSLREAGRILGIPKTSLARRRDKIRRELMTKLIDSEHIRDWLKR